MNETTETQREIYESVLSASVRCGGLSQAAADRLLAEHTEPDVTKRRVETEASHDLQALQNSLLAHLVQRGLMSEEAAARVEPITTKGGASKPTKPSGEVDSNDPFYIRAMQIADRRAEASAAKVVAASSSASNQKDWYAEAMRQADARVEAKFAKAAIKRNPKPGNKPATAATPATKDAINQYGIGQIELAWRCLEYEFDVNNLTRDHWVEINSAVKADNFGGPLTDAEAQKILDQTRRDISANKFSGLIPSQAFEQSQTIS